MGCLVVFIVILLIYWAVESPSTFFIGLCIVIGLCIWGYNVDKKRKEEQRQNKINEDEKNNKLFKEKKLQYNISDKYSIVNYKKGFAPIAKDKQYIWIEDNNLFFFPAVAHSKQ